MGSSGLLIPNAPDRHFESPSPGCLDTVDRAKIEKFFLPSSPRRRLVFINGFFSKKYSAESVSEGVVLSGSPHASVSVAPNTALGETVHLLFVQTGEKGKAVAFYPRVSIAVAEGAKLDVVVDRVSLADEIFFSSGAVEATVGARGLLRYTELQRYGRSGYDLSSAQFNLENHAELSARFFTHGGTLSRGTATVRFGGENASAELKGLCLLSGESQALQTVEADHATGKCVSRQFFKSILGGSSRFEFDSLVRVRSEAQKSDSRQLCRNLLLSEQARGIARPQLRIDADDVACAHGATTGQLDKDELFYLRSRGLSREIARYMLVYGFAEEILEDFGEGALRESLERIIGDELAEIVKA